MAATSWFRQRTSAARRARELLDRAKAKRGVRDGKHGSEFKDVPGLSKGQQLEIASMTAEELQRSMEAGHFTSEQIVRVFCSRAIMARERFGAVAEECYEEAIEMARESDERRRAGRLLGPLDGVPISVKDQYDQRGMDTTCGSAARCFRPKEADGLLLSLLREAGAIPFVRSNVPQGLLLPESTNHIWGACRNPWSLDRSAYAPRRALLPRSLLTPHYAPGLGSGGSSGGEGALLAARCSPLGLGTDIGGSIRIPAHYCGVTGFKGTPQRLTTMGLGVPRLQDRSGQEAVLTAPGPMARCVPDLVSVMRLWLSAAAYERSVYSPPVVWREELYQAGARSPREGGRRLRIGYFVTDNFFPPATACQRAVSEAVEALRGLGHELVPFSPLDAAWMLETYLALMAADGKMRCMMEALEGEPAVEQYRMLHLISRIPNVLRPALAALLSLLGEKRTAMVVRSGRGHSGYEQWCRVVERMRYQEMFVNKWREAGLDALVCPGGSLPALRHGDAKELVPSLTYTIMFNLLHMPAGTVPITRTKAGEDDYVAAVGAVAPQLSSAPGGARGAAQDRMGRLAARVVRGSEGLPVGVQVVALPYHDEQCLGVMRQLEQARPFTAVPPTAFQE